MKYGDFASLVQLGVGLHVGTALLQLYGELGVAPLARVLSRTRSLFAAPENERPPKAIEEELERLESRYEIFRVRLFKEYRKYVFFNLFAAGLLAIILTVLAFKAADPITQGWEWTTIFIPAFSALPGPISLAALWFDASRQVKPMCETADELEERATRSVVQRSPI
jgi:hypothetical protein